MSDKNLEALVTHLRTILPGILDSTPVTLAYLYGSVVAGRALPTSDIDIALVLCDDLDLSKQERLSLEFAVEHALEKQNIINSDVKIIDDAPLMFRGQVATSGIRLYSSNEIARVEFETRTWKEYLDFKPVADMMQQALLNNIKEHGLSYGLPGKERNI